MRLPFVVSMSLGMLMFVWLDFADLGILLTGAPRWEPAYGDIIWIQTHATLPFWPGYVFEPSQIPAANRSIADIALKRNKTGLLPKKFAIYLYASGHFDFATADKMKDFETHFEEMNGQTVKKDFVDLFKQAVTVGQAEIKLPKSERVGWIEKPNMESAPTIQKETAQKVAVSVVGESLDAASRTSSISSHQHAGHELPRVSTTPNGVDSNLSLAPNVASSSHGIVDKFAASLHEEKPSVSSKGCSVDQNGKHVNVSIVKDSYNSQHVEAETVIHSESLVRTEVIPIVSDHKQHPHQEVAVHSEETISTVTVVTTTGVDTAQNHEKPRPASPHSSHNAAALPAHSPEKTSQPLKKPVSPASLFNKPTVSPIRSIQADFFDQTANSVLSGHNNNEAANLFGEAHPVSRMPVMSKPPPLTTTTTAAVDLFSTPSGPSDRQQRPVADPTVSEKLAPAAAPTQPVVVRKVPAQTVNDASTLFSQSNSSSNFPSSNKSPTASTTPAPAPAVPVAKLPLSGEHANPFDVLDKSGRGVGEPVKAITIIKKAKVDSTSDASSLFESPRTAETAAVASVFGARVADVNSSFGSAPSDSIVSKGTQQTLPIFGNNASNVIPMKAAVKPAISSDAASLFESPRTAETAAVASVFGSTNSVAHLAANSAALFDAPAATFPVHTTAVPKAAIRPTLSTDASSLFDSPRSNEAFGSAKSRTEAPTSASKITPFDVAATNVPPAVVPQAKITIKRTPSSDASSLFDAPRSTESAFAASLFGSARAEPPGSRPPATVNAQKTTPFDVAATTIPTSAVKPVVKPAVSGSASDLFMSKGSGAEAPFSASGIHFSDGRPAAADLFSSGPAKSASDLFQQSRSQPFDAHHSAASVSTVPASTKNVDMFAAAPCHHQTAAADLFSSGGSQAQQQHMPQQPLPQRAGAEQPGTQPMYKPQSPAAEVFGSLPGSGWIPKGEPAKKDAIPRVPSNPSIAAVQAHRIEPAPIAQPLQDIKPSALAPTFPESSSGSAGNFFSAPSAGAALDFTISAASVFDSAPRAASAASVFDTTANGQAQPEFLSSVPPKQAIPVTAPQPSNSVVVPSFPVPAAVPQSQAAPQVSKTASGPPLPGNIKAGPPSVLSASPAVPKGVPQLVFPESKSQIESSTGVGAPPVFPAVGHPGTGTQTLYQSPRTAVTNPFSFGSQHQPAQQAAPPTTSAFSSVTKAPGSPRNDQLKLEVVGTDHHKSSSGPNEAVTEVLTTPALIPMAADSFKPQPVKRVGRPACGVVAFGFGGRMVAFFPTPRKVRDPNLLSPLEIER
jgi:hypothetical protein